MGLRKLISRLFRRSLKQPYRDTQRHPCPFYGFNGMFGNFFDQKGNQCGLLRDSYSPCQMDPSGERSNWEECSLNNPMSREFFEENASRIKIYPEEFWPRDREGVKAQSWEGITLKQWMDYIKERFQVSRVVESNSRQD